MFSLSISIDQTDIDEIKSDLRSSLPEVKSSHRCEAMARGLGFRTYASLRADATLSAGLLATANGLAFVDYLKSHGFDAAPAKLYVPAARRAIAKVMATRHLLNMWGWGSGGPRRKPDGMRETPAEIAVRMADAREKLRSAYAAEQFLQALAFLSRIAPTKTIRKNYSSYGLKHLAEEFHSTYPEGEKLGPGYITNGVFICAALHAGFVVDRNHVAMTQPNACFNMSVKSVRAVGNENAARHRADMVRIASAA